jgi:hypothetical protein
MSRECKGLLVVLLLVENRRVYSLLRGSVSVLIAGDHINLILEVVGRVLFGLI